MGELGLSAQAAPHLAAVLQAGSATIAALYDCAPDALPEQALPRHRRLLRDIAQYVAEPPKHAESFAAALSLAGDIEKALLP